LCPNRLDVVVVLSQHPSEVLEDLNPLEDVTSHRELLAKGKRRRYRRLTLFPALGPDPTLLRLNMARIKWVDLHRTPLAPWVASLGRDADKVERVYVAKVPPHHPSILKPT
jgi:hypothetical protein